MIRILYTYLFTVSGSKNEKKEKKYTKTYYAEKEIYCKLVSYKLIFRT